MVEKSKHKQHKQHKQKNYNRRIQGNVAQNTLIITVVILTVLGFTYTTLNENNSSSSTSLRSAPISNTNTYPYNQTYTQPNYTGQNNFQGRAGFASNSVTGDINAGAANLATTGAATIGTATGIAAAGITSNNQNNLAISNGEIIGLRPIQRLGAPSIPTTVPSTAITGRAILTPQNNSNAVINIDTVQGYHPQNQELIMEQACVHEVWQRNPYTIRSYPNLSVRLSANNPTSNGHMRTYSFNLDNRPTGNGALCTVTTDGYVTAISFY